MTRTRSIFLVLAFTALAACGKRPGITPGEGLDAATTPDAALPVDATAPLPDAAVPLPPCTWVAGQTHQITDPPNDKDVHSAAVTDTGVLIAWQVSNPDPPADNTRHLQRLTFLGEVDGSVEALFPPPGAMSSYGGVRLAAGPDHFGATVWDEAGQCRFRAIDAQGTVLGTWHTAADRNCGSLRSTPEGFSLFTYDWSNDREQRLVQLDPQGQPVSESEPIPALGGEVNWWATTRLPDGGYLVAGMHSGWDPEEIQIQRLNVDGVPRATPQVIAQLDAPAERIRLVQTPDGILAAWYEEASPDLHYQMQHVVVRPLDPSGVPVGPARRLTETPLAYRDSGWSLIPFEDQVLAAWITPEPDDSAGDETAIVIQPLTWLGAPDGDAVVLTEGRFLRHVILRRTPLGAIALFTGYPDALPHQIYSAALLCERH